MKRKVMNKVPTTPQSFNGDYNGTITIKHIFYNWDKWKLLGYTKCQRNGMQMHPQSWVYKAWEAPSKQYDIYVFRTTNGEKWECSKYAGSTHTELLLQQVYPQLMQICIFCSKATTTQLNFEGGH